jgi:HEAT repeat protein
MPFIKEKPSTTSRDSSSEELSDCEILIEQLEHADPTTRWWAARDLAERASEKASKALVSRLEHEEDPSVLEIILTALTCLGDKTAVAGLVKCLSSENVTLRNGCIEAMKQLPTQVGALMKDLLADPDPDVRIGAVNILETLRHPDVVEWLIDVIENDEHVNVCATALDLLVEVGSASSAPSLRRLKARFANEPYIQFAVDLALQRISAI